MKESPVKIDVLLEPLLLAGDDDDRADELLLQLINTHADPVIKGVIRFKLRLSSYRETQRAESDDIYQDVLLQLLSLLQKFRKIPAVHPIADLRGMAAVIAHRTCARWLRRQFPERVSKNHSLRSGSEAAMHPLLPTSGTRTCAPRLCVLSGMRPRRRRHCPGLLLSAREALIERHFRQRTRLDLPRLET